MVNGLEDLLRLDAEKWETIDWRAQEEQVRRLRCRIFEAAQEEDRPKARNLQKLMLQSRANTFTSVRQVTQRNAGRKTAGIDGEVSLTSEARAETRSVPGSRTRSGGCTSRNPATPPSSAHSAFR
ncbi:reverse transcriptase N-terminal domain-containing protein [Sinosporangium siamense]|uniref:Reverse transcriptase N-terminal domain-containing protein n=1 Tax=Sinosporangium siamense TaxID=1367973 RepID=A0A919RL29_9ACTN|nr:reverse transcriptase N-terminal domain-containing protein [Sinosporangium siamense]GII94379.1 hypothetical protein Ssi02_46100 [Sinosporangium siamense]